MSENLTLGAESTTQIVSSSGATNSGAPQSSQGMPDRGSIRGSEPNLFAAIQQHVDSYTSLPKRPNHRNGELTSVKLTTSQPVVALPNKAG